MPHISETPTDYKTRFGFHDHTRPSESSHPPVRNTPDLLKSVLKETPFNQSAVSSFRDRGDCSSVAVNLNDSFEFREDPSFWKDHNVQVIIRVRPLSSSEIAVQGPNKCVKQGSSQTITWIGPPEARFTFDHVADEHVSQEMLFKAAGLPMVENCMGGYNSCMFAYGQTGSGKTHTMLGDIDGGTRRHSVNAGMTPRVFEYLFTRIQKIREDTKKGVYVDNLKEVEVTSARDVIQQLIQGAANRKVASTNMNRASSRSHSWVSQGVTHHRFARLNLVDLAGSERFFKELDYMLKDNAITQAKKFRCRRRTLVIMNLVNVSSGKSLHVPYRDSKLTFLLQATVNEDASGDVIAMRMQIQQLKNEVSRLQNVINGRTGNNGDDALTVAFHGSPGSFKWDGMHGSFSPVTAVKRMSSKKEYEVALVGAFRRGKDKDITLQSLTAESQAALQLAKQREDEIQSLKMRLRFREAAIKRLEGVASGKISAETHLLKSFYEEGEQERMNEQIMILENKLLEALDWKLMHETQPSPDKKPSFDFMTDSKKDGDFFSLKDPVTPQRTQFEFPLVTTPNVTHVSDQRELQTMVDAIAAASQREAEAHETAIILSKENDELRAKLKMLIDDNNKLIELYDHAVADNQQKISQVDETQKNHVEQTEFAKKETELRRVNENLERQLAEMHEENDKLLGLYEKAMQERDELSRVGESQKNRVDQDEFAQKETELRSLNENLEHQLAELHEENDKLLGLYEKAMQEKDELSRVGESQKNQVDQTESAQKETELRSLNENLEHQLAELHEENDKLLGLYEKAMQERDQLSRVEQSRKKHVDQTEFAQKEIELRRLNENLEHQLAELHEENDRLLGLYEKAMEERDELQRLFSSGGQNTQVFEGNEVQMNDLLEDNLVEVNVNDDRSQYSSQTNEFLDPDEQMVENSTFCDESKPVDRINNNLQEKLDKVQEILSKSSENFGLFSSLEREIIDIDRLSRNIQEIKDDVLVKQKEHASTNHLISDLKERENTLERKLTAVKHSVSSFSKSLSYFEQREAQARDKAHAASSHLKSKKNELTRVLTIKDENERALSKIKQSEAELKNNIATLKLKTEEESKKRENDKVLLAIDNVKWQLAGKATELLKAEEEKTKLQLQMNQDQEKLALIKSESEKMTRKAHNLDKEQQVIELEIQKWSKSMEEIETKLQSNSQEKQILLDMKESGMTEFDNLFIEFQEAMFERKLKDEEATILIEEMEMVMKRLKELEFERGVCMQKVSNMVEETKGGLLFEKMVEDLESICSSFMELKGEI
ncbi:hypothetical protein M8C21_025799 [Ambrosia artemisiifolia]|uniref:Kinesin motor domain-containing protein n=1 Tax=Ambrosia artemisiifolia TaxID=4212 RepID=A0AAD5G9I8_AMBAR|nr:hypothetical protein M8C21_025799 [Ambrosia artemisiifolia]